MAFMFALSSATGELGLAGRERGRHVNGTIQPQPAPVKQNQSSTRVSLAPAGRRITEAVTSNRVISPEGETMRGSHPKPLTAEHAARLGEGPNRSREIAENGRSCSVSAHSRFGMSKSQDKLCVPCVLRGECVVEKGNSCGICRQ